MTSLVLASASPRRKALLQQIGVQAAVKPVDIDETPKPGEHAKAYVVRLAIEKAKAGQDAALGQKVVLGSDTIVVCDGKILEKPRDEDHAWAMLSLLSGRQHQVMTAVAVIVGESVEHRLVISDVQFRDITEGEARRYWATGEPLDKAGGYAIQGLGAVFVKKIHGSFSAVVGLPLYETAELLGRVGVKVWSVEPSA